MTIATDDITQALTLPVSNDLDIVFVELLKELDVNNDRFSRSKIRKAYEMETRKFLLCSNEYEEFMLKYLAKSLGQPDKQEV